MFILGAFTWSNKSKCPKYIHLYPQLPYLSLPVVNLTINKAQPPSNVKTTEIILKKNIIILFLGRKQSEDSVISLETEYSADTRAYHIKRFEIADTELDHFLGSGRMNKRRNAIVHKIDTMYMEGELHTFMENLLRSEYIETFLL